MRRLLVDFLLVAGFFAGTNVLQSAWTRNEQPPPDRAPAPVDHYVIDSLRREVAKLQASTGRNDSAIREILMCYWNAHPRHRPFLLRFVRAYFSDEGQGSRMTVHQEFDLGADSQ